MTDKHPTINNPIFSLFCGYGVCDEEQIEKINDRTRDNDQLCVYRCLKTGLIFLSDTGHMDIGHYDQKPPTHRYGVDKRAIVNTNDDSLRRHDRFANLIRGKSWLDIGAGSGAVLDQLAPLAKQAAAVEPQKDASETLEKLGYKVFRRLESVDFDHVDVITLFHVLEHIEYPEDVLKQCFELLGPGGRLVIEVPHASDLLIRQFDLPAFKDFTFWSEHLVLYTRYTLETLVRNVGFSNVAIEGVQRYPVANHLRWLAEGKPGGHIALDFMRDTALDSAYESMLQKLDMTDTLVLTAVKS